MRRMSQGGTGWSSSTRVACGCSCERRVLMTVVAANATGTLDRATFARSLLSRPGEPRVPFGDEDIRRIDQAGLPAGDLTDGAPHATSLLDIHCAPSSGNAQVDQLADLPGPLTSSIAGTLQLVR